MAGFCTFGSYGLPELAKNKLRNYYYPYEQCIMRGLTVSRTSDLTCACSALITFPVVETVALDFCFDNSHLGISRSL
jgi:hypothetical protein